MDGFSFCGVHCSTFGIGFVPSAAKRMWSTPNFKPINESVPYRPGGYHYGNQVDIREFVLECYFEEIDTETYERMLQWLHRDREGKLVFDDRPFVYYIVRPSKVVEGKMYPTSRSCKQSEETVYSGTMTITFSAEDPFGRMSYVSYEGQDMDDAQKRCGILPASMMPPTVLANTGEYLIYNPGTEIADTVIRIGGKAPNGVTIENMTNGDKCILLTLPPSPDYIELDSEAGCVKQLPSYPDGYAFEYHEEGYIRLEPCTPYQRNVSVSYSAGSNLLTFSDFALSKEYVGHYIRIGGEWLRVIAVTDERTAVANKFLNTSGTEKTTIAVMNQISVTGEGAQITKLEIEYVPRVR